MEIEMIRRELEEKLSESERVLVGIGAEWKRGDAVREAEIALAKQKLNALLEGKNYYVISTLEQEELERLGFESTHMVAPFDVSLTEEKWNHYMDWLSRTLNRRLVILELGEGFMNPTVIRWPFEKTTAINNKAFMYRIHKTFYQISDEIQGKALAVQADSAAFFAEWN